MKPIRAHTKQNVLNCFSALTLRTLKNIHPVTLSLQSRCAKIYDSHVLSTKDMQRIVFIAGMYEQDRGGGDELQQQSGNLLQDSVGKFIYLISL